jgi:oxygen-independent coproporphyrinogen-3 oxidase
MKAGLYLHIPFCRKACHYCDFHFTTSGKYFDRMAAAMMAEWDLRIARWDHPFGTLYLGGGTPGMLPEQPLRLLLNHLQKQIAFADLGEITLEANPDDLTASNLHLWKELGITRLSIGVQSFADDHLRWMNRSHTAQQAIDGLKQARKAGFEHFNLDLIYGFESLSNKQWTTNVEQALDLGVNHLSCYTLTVEPNTALGRQTARTGHNPTPDALALEHYDILCKKLDSIGWEHYEISNFCKPGHRSVHNTAYWNGHPYLGIGPSAHSFNHHTRWWNISNNIRYMQAVESGHLPSESEPLTRPNRINESLLTGIRQKEGINKIQFVSLFGQSEWEALLHKISGDSRFVLTDSAVALREEHWLLADALLPHLFVADDGPNLLA